MEIYIARGGDTLQSVARRFSQNAETLRRVNALNDPTRLTPGLALLIPGGDTPTSSMELGAYGAGAWQTYRGLLPSLSFVCPCRARIMPDGRIAPFGGALGQEDALTRETAPLFAVSNADGQGEYSAANAHRLLSEPLGADMLLEAAAPALEQGFRGIYLELLWLYPFDREPYNRLLQELSKKLHRLGAYLVTALAPKEESGSESLVCAGHDYACHGQYADRCVLLGLDWGNALSAPQAIAPSGRIRAALDYASGKLPAGKLMLALSAHGYNWRLPWRQGEAASPIFHTAAANMAVSLGAEVRFDRGFSSPYFTYTDPIGVRHAVWFEDVRCTRRQLELAGEYSLGGLFFMNAGRIPSPSLRLIQSRYTAEVFA